MLRRASPVERADWFAREVFEKKVSSWISGGDVYQDVSLRYAYAALKTYKLPDHVVLPEQISYAISHSATSFRAVCFIYVWKIEIDTLVDVVDDIMVLDKARKNVRGSQGILEIVGMALQDMEMVLISHIFAISLSEI